MSPSKFDGKHCEITEIVLNAFYKVHRTMGFGFNEKVDENSLAIELRKAGLQVAQQQEIEVYYEGQLVGTYFVDIVVNEVVMLELKAAKQLLDEHEAQILNYLKATRLEVGLLLSFGPTASLKRFTYDNDRKGPMGWILRETKEGLDTHYKEATDL